MASGRISIQPNVPHAPGSRTPTPATPARHRAPIVPTATPASRSAVSTSSPGSRVRHCCDQTSRLRPQHADDQHRDRHDDQQRDDDRRPRPAGAPERLATADDARPLGSAVAGFVHQPDRVRVERAEHRAARAGRGRSRRRTRSTSSSSGGTSGFAGILVVLGRPAPPDRRSPAIRGTPCASSGCFEYFVTPPPDMLMWTPTSSWFAQIRSTSKSGFVLEHRGRGSSDSSTPTSHSPSVTASRISTSLLRISALSAQPSTIVSASSYTVVRDQAGDQRLLVDVRRVPHAQPPLPLGVGELLVGRRHVGDVDPVAGCRRSSGRARSARTRAVRVAELGGDRSVEDRRVDRLEEALFGGGSEVARVDRDVRVGLRSRHPRPRSARGVRRRCR